MELQIRKEKTATMSQKNPQSPRRESGRPVAKPPQLGSRKQRMMEPQRGSKRLTKKVKIDTVDEYGFFVIRLILQPPRPRRVLDL